MPWVEFINPNSRKTAVIIKPNKNLSSLELVKQIGAELTPEEKVKVTHLGVFKAKKTKPRTGRNPRTGVLVEIPSKIRVSFKASKTLLDKLEGKFK